MPKKLSEKQQRDYRADGYIYPLDALSAAVVARYREELRKTEERLGGSLMAIDKKYRGNLHFLCKWVDELARTPAIVDAAEDLLGPDILLYTTRFFIKEPHSEGIAAWHQDSTYFGLRPFDHVTAWVALCNVTAEAGPVEFAVGSHIRGQLLQKSGLIKNSVNTAGHIIVEWFDFISKRRYSKRERYAIPYNGADVYLYWANHDQYYIKTGEYFTNYTYKAPNGDLPPMFVPHSELEFRY